MKVADAPPAGWYPDPTGRAGLRWWNGLDWTDHRRAPVPTGPQDFISHTDRDEAAAAAAAGAGGGAPSDGSRIPPSMRGSRDQAADVMAEARKAAKDEVDRAIAQMGQRASAARKQYEPLITEYGTRLLKGLRTLFIVVVVLVVLWMVLQTVGQATLLDWIGDRIDDLTDGGSASQRLGLGTWRGSNP